MDKKVIDVLIKWTVDKYDWNDQWQFNRDWGGLNVLI